ncbi:YHYH domain-containing protein [Rhizobium leguminosarum]|nr:YHYH domain-containing protein [Rhizobium leguminosarum]
MLKFTLKITLALIALASTVAPALSHGGGTDKNGCHNDRKSGGYHCH